MRADKEQPTAVKEGKTNKKMPGCTTYRLRSTQFKDYMCSCPVGLRQQVFVEYCAYRTD